MGRRLWGRRFGAVLLAAVVMGITACAVDAPERERVDETSSELVVASLVARGDTEVQSARPNINFGRARTMRVRGDESRALVMFDPAAIAALEADGARIELTLSAPAQGSAGRRGARVSLYRLLEPWTELGATWSCAIDANPSNGRMDCAGPTRWNMSGRPPLPWSVPATATVRVRAHDTGVVSFDIGADLALYRSGTPFYGYVIMTTKEEDEHDRHGGGHGNDDHGDDDHGDDDHNDDDGELDLTFATRETRTPPRLVATCSRDGGRCDGDGGPRPDGGGSSDGGGGSDSGSGPDAASDAGIDSGVDAGPACTPGSCEDNDPCSTDTCTITGCTHEPAPDGTPCTGDSLCVIDNVCVAGKCAGGTPIPTSDFNSCTIDSCDPELGVLHLPAPAGTACPNETRCDGDEVCDGAGSCIGGIPPVLSDGNPCTDDQCDAVAGVTHVPRPAGDLACSDHDACNGEEICNGAGACLPGTGLSVDDGNICTADSCSALVGPVHTPIPNCNPTPTQGGAPFETRASLMGRVMAGGSAVTGVTFTVTDAPLAGAPVGTPRTDVVASSAGDGSFRLRLTTFPDAEAERTPPHHVVLRVEGAGYLPAYRDAWLHVGDAADLGVIKLAARDPVVTNIGPEGGTARDSLNRVEVVVPPGALATTVPIRITTIPNRDEMPGLLPETTATMYGFELEPTGTTFAVPVTVRMANWRNLPTTLVIPVGYFDIDRARWEHVGQSTWDGARFSFTIDHFSNIDGNSPRPGSGPDPGPGPGPGPGPDPDDGPCPPPPPPPGPNSPDPGPDPDIASSCDLIAGNLRQTFPLPTHQAKDETFGITLDYVSLHAGGATVGAAPTSTYGAVSHAPFNVPVASDRVTTHAVASAAALGTQLGGQPGLCTQQGGLSQASLGQATPTPLVMRKSVAGSSFEASVMVGLSNTEIEIPTFVPLPQSSSSESPPPGMYAQRMTLTQQTPGTCITTTPTFGVSTDGPKTQTSLEGGPIATIDSHVFLPHRLTSPFGAGWSIAELSRVYGTGDRVYLFQGSGAVESFGPRIWPHGLGSDGRDIVPARDDVTGELFGARNGGSIEQLNPATGAATVLRSGVWPSDVVQALAIAYVGGARHFIVGLSTQVLDVDSAGAVRVIATRAPPPLYAQLQLAARGSTVFYTNAVDPVLYRISLTDPSPAPLALSVATASGGDVRLHPKAPLSGVRFASPRGLAFAADGTLYVTDVGRNVVYAIAPSGTGEVDGASRVDVAVGNGNAITAQMLGERSAGPAFRIREPLGVSVGEDGLVVLVTTYGVALYDPVAREAEWVALTSGIDEVYFDPTFAEVGFVALTGGSFLSRNGSIGPFALVRVDLDRLSSQWKPTRSMRRLPGGGFELTDTTAARIERFDAAGRLVERAHRTGETILTATYADATSDRVATIGDAVGGQTVFEYDGSGKAQRIVDAQGRVTTLAVNGLGDLESLTEPGSEAHQFAYASHRMTEKRSPRGDVTTYTFRDDGTLRAATRPEGGTSTVQGAFSSPPSMNAANKVVRSGSFTDAHGLARSFVLNRMGERESETFTEGGVTRTIAAQYQPDGSFRTYDYFAVSDCLLREDFATARKNYLFLTTGRLENGVLRANPVTFDAHGRPAIEAVFGSGGGCQNVHDWLYDANGWLKEEYQGFSYDAQKYERDAAGHVTRIYTGTHGSVSAVGRDSRWTYRPDGLVATALERGVTRTFVYDDAGGTKNRLGWTDSLGRSETLTRDLFGNVASRSDGTAITYSDYDVRNRVIRTRDALGHETTYGYTHAGCNCTSGDRVTSIHTPDLPPGVDWEMTYDRDGRLSSVTDPQGFRETYEYEPSGELRSVIDKLLRSTTWSHDGFGRVTSTVDTASRVHTTVYPVPVAGAWVGPGLTAASADGTASTTSLTAPLRTGDYQIGKNAYPIAGYPANVSLYRDATFALAYTERFDQHGRLTNRWDRLFLPLTSTTVPPNGSSATLHAETFSYDNETATESVLKSYAVGPLSAAISNDVTNLERLVTTGLGFYGPKVNESFTRDAGGRVTQLRRTFTAASDPSDPMSITPPPDQSSTYTYRPDGRLGRLVNPDGTHDFTYDPRGLLETQTVAGEGTYTYGYDEVGRNTWLGYPDGHVRRQTYDEVGRLKTRCYEYSLGLLRCYGAEYDAVGNPVALTDPEGRDVIEYDALDRVKRVTRTEGATVGVEDYGYNALGALKLNAGVALDDQRPRLDGGGQADAAVPATFAGQPVTLDPGGRVTSFGGATYEYATTPWILRSVTPPAPDPKIRFGQDTDLRRIAEVRGTSAAEFYYYEGQDRVATVGPSTTGVLDAYLFDDIDHPLRIKRGSAVVYYELDLAGNVRGLRLSGGSDLGGYRYTAFGKTVADTSTFVQPLRWKGRWWQSLAGREVYDVRARQWSPELGSFLSIDGYEFHNDKTALWGWPNQNPERWSDSSGHQACPAPPKPKPKPKPKRNCTLECEPYLGIGRCYMANDGYTYCNDMGGQHAFQMCVFDCRMAGGK